MNNFIWTNFLQHFFSFVQKPEPSLPCTTVQSIGSGFEFSVWDLRPFSVWILSFDLVHSDTLSIILNSTNYRLHFSIKFYHSFRVSSSRLDKNRHLCIGFTRFTPIQRLFSAHTNPGIRRTSEGFLSQLV